MISDHVCVLLSGGQDSLAVLLWARESFKSIEAVSFTYGQRHQIENQYSSALARRFSVPHTAYNLSSMFEKLSLSALTSAGDVSGVHPHAAHLPASFVPNRNGLFFTAAASHAFARRAGDIHLAAGVCQTDYSGYPDCRDVYVKAKAEELSLGLDRKVYIHTPLMFLTKAETWAIAEKAGELQTMIEETITCYEGSEKMHEWGRGCGICPACVLREKGWLEFKKNAL